MLNASDRSPCSICLHVSGAALGKPVARVVNRRPLQLCRGRCANTAGSLQPTTTKFSPFRHLTSSYNARLPSAAA